MAQIVYDLFTALELRRKYFLIILRRPRIPGTPRRTDLDRNSDLDLPDLAEMLPNTTLVVLPPLSSSDLPKGRDPRPPARLGPRSWGRLMLAVLEWPAIEQAR